MIHHHKVYSFFAFAFYFPSSALIQLLLPDKINCNSHKSEAAQKKSCLLIFPQHLRPHSHHINLCGKMMRFCDAFVFHEIFILKLRRCSLDESNLCVWDESDERIFPLDCVRVIFLLLSESFDPSRLASRQLLRCSPHQSRGLIFRS